MAEQLLVIGYGSNLHGDDMVGRILAEAVEEWQVPGVEVLSAHQLTPELAERVAKARVVLFADASVETDHVTLQPVLPGRPLPEAHQVEPEGIVGLARAVYGKAPPAWLLHLPAEGFELGAGMSRRAARGLVEGLAWVRCLLDEELACTR